MSDRISPLPPPDDAAGDAGAEATDAPPPPVAYSSADEIPEEIWTLVLLQPSIAARQMGSLAAVCRRLQQAARSAEIWRVQHARIFGME